MEYSFGSPIILLALKIWIIPCPFSFCRKKSFTSKAGSPKNSFPPASSKATTERIRAFKLWVGRFPKEALYSLLFSATYCNTERRSLVSISKSPSSSAIRKTTRKISLCTSVQFSTRLKSNGPISEIVQRRGIPSSLDRAKSSTEKP